MSKFCGSSTTRKFLFIPFLRVQSRSHVGTILKDPVRGRELKMRRCELYNTYAPTRQQIIWLRGSYLVLYELVVKLNEVTYWEEQNLNFLGKFWHMDQFHIIPSTSAWWTEMFLTRTNSLKNHRSDEISWIMESLWVTMNDLFRLYR